MIDNFLRVCISRIAGFWGDNTGQRASVETLRASRRHFGSSFDKVVVLTERHPLYASFVVYACEWRNTNWNARSKGLPTFPSSLMTIRSCGCLNSPHWPPLNRVQSQIRSNNRAVFDSRSPSQASKGTRTPEPRCNPGNPLLFQTETVSEEGSFRFTVFVSRTPSDPGVHSAACFGLP